MSVQLVVYPQWYEDGVSVIPTVPSEMVTAPQNFLNANGGTAFNVSASTLSLNAIMSLYSSMYAGNWYGYYKTGTGGVIGGWQSLELENTASGVFQRLSGMVVGALYEVKVTFITGFAYPIDIRIYNVTGIHANQEVTPVSDVATFQFTAPSINETTLNLDFFNESNHAKISYVSVKQVVETPPTAVQELENGSVICDLYEEENIPLTLSVDNFKNAAEKVQSYSKAFNLPATKRNNQIFDNVFEITRYVDGQSINFNPLIQTKAILKQDGFVIFEGFLRLLDISEKNGELSYNVNLYAEVTALADLLKERTFEELGFEELEHDYNITQIQYSWNSPGSPNGITYANPNTSGFRDTFDTVKYPFVDWNHQMVVSDGAANTSGNPQLTKLEDAFRPFIQLKYLIDRIFENIPFTYTSTFFSTTTFKKLYMDFNWGASEVGAAPARNASLYQQTDGSTQYMTQAFQLISLQTTVSGDNTFWNVNRFTSDVNNLEVVGSYRLTLRNVNGLGASRGVEMRLQKMKIGSSGGVVVLETIASNNGTIADGGTINGIMEGNFSTTLNSNEFIGFRAKQYSSDSNQVKVNTTNNSFINITSYNNDGARVYTLLDSARADVNQWDFLKGIITMFNLVTIPDPDDVNNIIIETYENVFVKSSNNNSISLADRGITHNWTDKVDYETMKIAPLSDLNKKTVFKFVEDEDDYPFSVYKRDVNGFLYGSFTWDASDLTLLAGEEEVVAEPFAATVIKPLMSQYPEFVIPSLYSMSEDGETASFDNSPRIIYNVGLTNLTGTLDYYVAAQNGVGATTLTQYIRTGHLSQMPSSVTSLDYNFGACQLIPENFTATVNGLFNRYWLPYYDELYDPNTRVVTVKINLNAGDINTFKFNDQIMIKNRTYRVNKIDYKPNDLATVELILLNYV